MTSPKRPVTHKVLLVDDDDAVRAMTVFKLSGTGRICCTASTQPTDQVLTQVWCGTLRETSTVPPGRMSVRIPGVSSGVS